MECSKYETCLNAGTKCGECLAKSVICVPENTSLWSLYRNADDELTYGHTWRIYDTSNHNRMLTNNYGQLPSNVLPEIDKYTVVSAYIEHDFLVVKVYVKPVKEEE